MRLLIFLTLLSVCSCSSGNRNEELNWQNVQIEKAKLELTGDQVAPVLIDPRGPDSIAPGFLIKLSFVQDENLNGEFRIDETGLLTLPYDVKVKIEPEDTEVKLEGKIRGAYASFFRSLQGLDVKVKEKKYYVITKGLLKKPGVFLIERDSSLDKIIAESEGLQEGDSAPKFLKISNGYSSVVLRLDDYFAGRQSFTADWRGGEKLFFQAYNHDLYLKTKNSRPTVQIMGQVSKPGEYFIKEETDFFYYLALAGGPTDKADLENIMLIRRGIDKSESLDFALNEIETIPALEGGDVLMFNADTRTQKEKDTSILGTIGGLFTSLATTVLLGFSL